MCVRETSTDSVNYSSKRVSWLVKDTRKMWWWWLRKFSQYANISLSLGMSNEQNKNTSESRDGIKQVVVVVVGGSSRKISKNLNKLTTRWHPTLRLSITLFNDILFVLWLCWCLTCEWVSCTCVYILCILNSFVSTTFSMKRCLVEGETFLMMRDSRNILNCWGQLISIFFALLSRFKILIDVFIRIHKPTAHKTNGA